MYNNLPIKWIVIEDYEAETSAVIALTNHSYIDGIQFIAAFKHLSVRKDQ